MYATTLNYRYNKNMENIETPQPQKKSKFKLYLLLAFLIMTLGIGGYGYFKYNNYVEMQREAQQALVENTRLKNEVARYEQLKNLLIDETEECEELLTKEEGNFAKFSYCQDFLEFSKSLESLIN